MVIDISYPNILKQFERCSVSGGTESRSLLAWFLENYYRLEDVEIQDSLCDGSGDKGIDGIYVSQQLHKIDFFQVTLGKAEEKTLGDKKLKQFVGALAQFSNVENAKSVLANANPELVKMAERLELLECIADGYEIRGVFVTNAIADVTAITYIGTQPQIALYDGQKLKDEYLTIDKTDPIATPITFDVTGISTLQHQIDSTLKMVIAPITAVELVKMEGISSGDLFAWNVRQWLGKGTAVNKQIAESIKAPSEHKYFPAFHNGVTILCKKLTVSKEEITISGYAVVNGCQSITNLFENKAKLTTDLRILTKFVEIEPDSDLASKITDHSNNQNGTKDRDLQSNNPVQTRLQSEIHKLYPQIHYRIKRGEHPEWPKDTVIENELLARIILAFDLDKPEAWSQNYKLFGELHGELFARPEMNAHRAVFLHDAYIATKQKLAIIEDQFFGSYVLTRWLLLDLVRECLMTEELGKKLQSNPSDFMNQLNGRERIKTCIGHIAQNVARLLSAHAKRRYAQAGTDYKKDLKSKEHIEKVRSEIVPQYQIILDSKLTECFEQKWNGTNTLVLESGGV